MLIKGTVNRTCVICGEGEVTTTNKQGCSCCRKCKDKTVYASKCPVCGGINIDALKSKKGVLYFKCYSGCPIQYPDRLAEFGFLKITKE